MVYLAHFIGAVFLVNFLPHFVSGVCGRSFQSPFAKPPGIGLSSPQSNVLWGGLNFIVALLLLYKVGPFNPADTTDLVVTLAGGWLTAFFLARYFGRFHAEKTTAK